MNQYLLWVGKYVLVCGVLVGCIVVASTGLHMLSAKSTVENFAGLALLLASPVALVAMVAAFIKQGASK